MRKSPKLALQISKSALSPAPIQFHSDCFFPSKTLAQINDQIFIGSYEDACDFDKLRSSEITDIINCSPVNCPNNFQKEFNYFNFELVDTQDFDLWAPLNAIIKLLEQLRQQGRKVLIHCYQGVSRAPSIAIGYLIQCEDRNIEDAIRHVKRNYNKADPNIGFMIQLEQYYKERHQKGSL